MGIFKSTSVALFLSVFAAGTAQAQGDAKLVLICESRSAGTQILTLDLANKTGNLHTVGGEVAGGAMVSANDVGLVLTSMTDDSVVWKIQGNTFTLNRYTGSLTSVWAPEAGGGAGPSAQCHKQEKQF